jgi:acetyl esterase
MSPNAEQKACRRSNAPFVPIYGCFAAVLTQRVVWQTCPVMRFGHNRPRASARTPRMPLHPTVAAMAQAMAQNPDYRPTHQLTPQAARDGYRALPALLGPRPEVGAVQDRTIDGPGGPLRIRVYTPKAPAATGPQPVLMYLHGGGWVIGDLDTHDRECRILCNDTPCVVVAVDYRLAPEHPYPAAVEDAWAALQWLVRHAHELGGDPERVAIGGDSAGGNLAAIAALRARDAGGPALRAQLLIYPSVGGSLLSYPSHSENAHAPFLPLDSMRYFRGHYLGALDTTTDPEIAPIHAASHKKLPAALIITAEFDPLRDEGRAYARKLEEAGVAVRFIEYAGMPHMFYQLSPILEEAKAALRESAEALRKAFAG